MELGLGLKLKLKSKVEFGFYKGLGHVRALIPSFFVKFEISMISMIFEFCSLACSFGATQVAPDELPAISGFRICFEFPDF